jgi:hypothetical protein
MMSIWHVKSWINVSYTVPYGDIDVAARSKPLLLDWSALLVLAVNKAPPQRTR